MMLICLDYPSNDKTNCVCYDMIRLVDNLQIKC